MHNYFNEIENIIVEREASKKVNELIDKKEDLLSKWNIGKLLVEAQGGEKRAKYGDGLIKEWGKMLSAKYGKGYDVSNLKRFRQFYLAFSKGGIPCHQLSWSHIRYILPIKNQNARNYYINQIILNKLSVNELINEIRSNAFNRLSYALKDKINIVDTDNYTINIKDMIKDPILINVNEKDIDEKVLHKYIINMLEEKFLEFGIGFNLTGHEYKIINNNRTYKIDLLFFNTELNSYVAFEIKTRELHKEDISQLQFYVNYIDKNIKKKYHNNTIGVLIVKKNNKFVVEYTTSKDIYITTYKLINK